MGTQLWQRQSVIFESKSYSKQLITFETLGLGCHNKLFPRRPVKSTFK